MAWRGGFTGRGYTRDEFRAFLRAQNKPSWIRFLVSHNTAAPYIKPPVPASTRMQNLGAYYKGLGWSSGPNLVAIYDRLYTGTPLAYPGTNSPGYNGKGLGIEVEGDYRTGKHDPKSGDGAVAWATAAWGFAELLAWLGLPLDDAHLKLHREDPKTTHQCPGNLVTKPWLMGLVGAAMGKPAEKPTQAVPANPTTPPYDTRTIQERLKTHGFDPGPIDGIMGPKTQAAIKAFQTSVNVTANGLIGPWAFSILQKAPPATPAVVVPPAVSVLDAPILAPNTPETNPAKAIRLLMTEAQFPRHWAAAAVAQAQRESYPDLRPWAQGDWFLNGKPSKKGTPGAEPTAFTIWQLRGPRWEAYNAWAKSRGKPWDDFETQVLWCPQELKTSEKLAYKWLVKAETVEQANAAMVWFERPKGYISSNAKAATTWDEVFAVSEKCDGYDVRLKFAKALM